MTRHLVCLIDGRWVSEDTSVLNQTYSNIFKVEMLLANYSKSNEVHEDNIIFYSRGARSTEQKNIALHGRGVCYRSRRRNCRCVYKSSIQLSGQRQNLSVWLFARCSYRQSSRRNYWNDWSPRRQAHKLLQGSLVGIP